MLKDVITAIDIGTSKLVGASAEVEDGKVKELIGISEVPSSGLRKGEVVDYQAFLEALSMLREEMQENKIRISPNIFIGISSRHLTYRIGYGEVRIEGGTVTPEHIDIALDNVKPSDPPKDERLITVVPRAFILDDRHRVRNPIGMTANTSLEVEAFMFYIPETLVFNFLRALNELDFKVDDKGIFPTSLASSVATLTEEEKESGTLLIDLGHGTTDVIFYFKGSPSFSFTLPVGSFNITYDIEIGLRTNEEEAERIKRTFVTLNLDEISENDAVTYQPRYGSMTRTIRLKNLVTDIVIPRIEQSIVSQIKLLTEKAFRGAIPPIGGIVLTGGGALLKGLPEYLSKSFDDLPVRIGTPIDDWVPEDLKLPNYSTIIGLLKLGASRLSGEELEPRGVVVIGRTSKKKGFFRKVLGWIRELF